MNKQIFEVSSTTKKKINIIVISQLILLFLLCVFFPMTTILYKKLEEIEHYYLYQRINILQSELLNSKTFYYFSYLLLLIFTNKDTIIIYIHILYYLYHPFISIKITTVTFSFYFFVVIMQCIFRSLKPFWSIDTHKEKTDKIHFCETNFGNPSDSFFVFSLFFLHLIISYLIGAKKQKYLYIRKIVTFSVFIPLTILLAYIYIVNQINYLFQLIFSLSLSLIIVCFLIEFDEYLHLYINDSFKTIIQCRSTKMKIFYTVITMALIAIFGFFFIETGHMVIIEDGLEYFNTCADNHFNIDFFGTQRTLLNITPIFGIIGAFWGFGYSMERNCGIWWKTPFKKLIIKLVAIIAIDISLTFLCGIVTHSTFQVIFTLHGLKYFIQFYIVMGPLPVLFDKIGFNMPNYKKLDSIPDMLKLDQSFFEEINKEKVGSPIKERENIVIDTSNINIGI